MSLFLSYHLHWKHLICLLKFKFLEARMSAHARTHTHAHTVVLEQLCQTQRNGGIIALEKTSGICGLSLNLN